MKIIDQSDKKSIKPYVLEGDVVKFITSDGREFLLVAVSSECRPTCSDCVLSGAINCDIWSNGRERSLCYTGQDDMPYCAFKFVDDLMEDL